MTPTTLPKNEIAKLEAITGLKAKEVARDFTNKNYASYKASMVTPSGFLAFTVNISTDNGGKTFTFGGVGHTAFDQIQKAW